MSIFKKIALCTLFGFLTIFSLNKFVSADSIYVSYESNFQIDTNVISGNYNNSYYEFYLCDIYVDNSSITYNISSMSFLISLAIDTTDIEDLNLNFYYCFGREYSSSVTDIFNTYNVNTFEYFFENPRGFDYNVLKFEYSFDSPIVINDNDFYFYVGCKETSEVSPMFSNNGFLCLPNSVGSDLSYQDIYNEVYNDFSNSFDSLNNDYTTLQTAYNTLNNNYTSLQTTYNTLQQNYSTLQTQYNELANSEYSFNNLMWAISAIPFGIFGSMFNFEILGVNFFALVTGIITGFIVVWFIKKFIFK